MKKIDSVNIKNKKMLLVLIPILLLIVPLFNLNSFVMRMIVLIGVYTILGLSLNLVTGFTGQLSLGHAAFYAIGAYTSSILSMRFGWDFIITALMGAILAGFFGFLLGIPTLKLQGAYLAIVTLGFCEIVRIVALNWMSVTRGPMGLPGIPCPKILGFVIDTNTEYYYLILILVALTILVINNILNSKIGRAFIAIREDELAAQSMGVKTTRYKIISFTISAFFAGLAGAFYAHYVTYIDPQSFVFDESILILSIVILGGLGSIKGTILGASLLITVPEALRALNDYRMVMYGAVLIIMMLVRPQGILGGRKNNKLKIVEEIEQEIKGTAKGGNVHASFKG